MPITPLVTHRPNMRRRGSCRSVVPGAVKMSAENPLGMSGRCPEMLVYCHNAKSTPRSKFLGLCRKYNVSCQAVETREGKNDQGQAIKIGTIFRIFGRAEGMEIVCKWIDTELNFHTELCVSACVPRAAGQGTLSEGAKRRGKLNKHQRSEARTSYQKQADKLAADERAESQNAERFFRAASYAAFLQSLPEAERIALEERNQREAEAREKAPELPPFAPMNGAPPVKADCSSKPRAKWMEDSIGILADIEANSLSFDVLFREVIQDLRLLETRLNARIIEARKYAEAIEADAKPY